jgi:uncharacterized protein YlxW (UPF0749 family)
MEYLMSSDAEYILRSVQKEMYTLEDETIYLRSRIKSLEEKIEASNKLCDELAQFIYSMEDLLDFNNERNELLLRYEQERR